MSRESEKVLKELQKFLDAHAEDPKNECPDGAVLCRIQPKVYRSERPCARNG